MSGVGGGVSEQGERGYLVVIFFFKLSHLIDLILGIAFIFYGPNNQQGIQKKSPTGSLLLFFLETLLADFYF